MPPFDFPGSPSEGQIFNAPSGPTYVFNSPVWKAVGQGQIAIVSDTPPANPANGTLWLESDTGTLFVYWNDGNSSQWVQVGGTAAANSVFDVAADMSIGFRTSGNRFVVNDKADLTGTDVMTVTEAGALTVSGGLINGAGIGSGYFFAAGTTAQFCTTGAGNIFLRPNGVNNTAGQITIDSAGGMNKGTFSATGLSFGCNYANAANMYSASNGNGTAAHAVWRFFNTNGQVGAITSSAAATAYATSSDENLKDFIGPYDPQEAIAIIRADPVREFTWKMSGERAVGWGAQTSYAISPDLAVPPPEEDEPKAPGEEGYAPWGVDQGRRTPYLWAAVTALLDEVEALKARIAELEGSP